jgi:hypothetical protein
LQIIFNDEVKRQTNAPIQRDIRLRSYDRLILDRRRL